MGATLELGGRKSGRFLYSGYNKKQVTNATETGWKRKGEAMPAEKMTPEKIKHLEFIQDVITRMNNNSFQMKAWMVAIVSALLAVYASTKNHYFVLVAILPTIIFWFLDTYYLWQERKFRGLYNDVAGITKNNKITLFAMRPDLYAGGKYSYWNVFFSVTMLLLYLPVSVILWGIYFIL